MAEGDTAFQVDANVGLDLVQTGATMFPVDANVGFALSAQRLGEAWIYSNIGFEFPNINTSGRWAAAYLHENMGIQEIPYLAVAQNYGWGADFRPAIPQEVFAMNSRADTYVYENDIQEG